MTSLLTCEQFQFKCDIRDYFIAEALGTISGISSTQFTEVPGIYSIGLSNVC